MKRIVFILILLAILSLGFANAMIPYAVKKLWIDTNGDLHVRYFDATLFGTVTMDLYDGTNHFVDTIDFSNPDNFDKVYPDANVSAMQGYVSVTNNLWSYQFADSLRWGYGQEGDLSPLSPGECAMQVHHPYYSDSEVLWVKELDLYMDSVYWPETRSNLDVIILDSYGNPVGNYPVFMWSDINPTGLTDQSGHFSTEVLCAKLRVLVKHPQTQEAVIDTIFFAEPLQTYIFGVQLGDSDGEDPLTPLQRGIFSVYPTVLRHGVNDLHLAYDGKLPNAATVELYDLKGRLIGKQEYTSSGMNWQLAALPNGVYFIRLVNGKQNLGSCKLIILK